MSQILLNVPDIDSKTVAVAAVLVVAALIASVIVEVYRRHYSKKNFEKLGKAWTALLLAAISSAFTGLGYLLLLAQSNTEYLSTLPFVGKHIFGVLGVAYTIYNLRLNKTYQTIADKLNKWTKKTPKTPPQPKATDLPETDSTFETA